MTLRTLSSKFPHNIGANAPSDLVIWEGNFSSVSFCAQSRTARFGEGSTVSRSTCDGIWPEPARCFLR